MIRKPIQYRSYHHLHSILRRKLCKIAFDSHYICETCGSHTDLEIHIPDMSRLDQDNKGSWIILCKSCHRALRRVRK
jgi:predicted SprT family Zn-dependent metalloprotease